MSGRRPARTAVVFDCDGTLLDSMPAWHRFESDLARRAGIALTPSQVDLLNANTLEQTVAYFHETYGLGESFAGLLEEARGILLASYRDEVAARRGASELLGYLDGRGVPMAVASSSPGVFLEAGLARAGLLGFFDLVVSAEDERASKRDPGFYVDVVRRLGVDPQDAWGIDDSVYAIDAMRGVGFSTVGIYDSDAAGTFDQLEQHADMAIRNFEDLDFERIA